MINDDNQFDETLRTTAQDYNRPPSEIPRDAMWAGIMAAREERAARPLQVLRPSPRRSFAGIPWLGAAAAAVLLVASGVGIGRWSNARNIAAPPVAASNAGTTRSGSRQTLPTDEPATGERSAGRAERAASSGERVAGNGQRAADTGRRTPEPGRRIADNGQQPTDNGQPMTGNGQRAAVPYQVATVRHLANAEALLTAFRTDSRDAKLDAQLGTWARDLLSNTRLLLDSPAGDDPLRARLLGDLELVLAQIVQLSPGAAAQDRELIEGSIRNGQMMTRLRYAIPAGPTRGL